MSKEKAATQPTFMDNLKADFEKAAWQTGAVTFSKATKKGVIVLLQKMGAFGKDDAAPKGKKATKKPSKVAEAMQTFEEILDTKLGDVAMMALIGYGGPHVPFFNQDPRFKRIVEECRVQAMATGMQEIAGVAMATFFPVIQTALAALPDLNTDSIAELAESSSASEAEDEAEAEEEAAAPAKKSRKAGT